MRVSKCAPVIALIPRYSRHPQPLDIYQEIWKITSLRIFIVIVTCLNYHTTREKMRTRETKEVHQKYPSTMAGLQSMSNILRLGDNSFLEGDTGLREETTVDRSSGRKGNGRGCKDNTLNVSTCCHSHGARYNPNNVLRKGTSKEDDPLASSDGQGSRNL